MLVFEQERGFGVVRDSPTLFEQCLVCGTNNRARDVEGLPLSAFLIILPARRGFTEDRIGFIDRDHPRWGFRSGVPVGMKLHCKQSISLMNFFEAGRRRDA